VHLSASKHGNVAAELRDTTHRLRVEVTEVDTGWRCRTLSHALDTSEGTERWSTHTTRADAVYYALGAVQRAWTGDVEELPGVLRARPDFYGVRA
jgi:hypothetical protein